MTTVVGTGIDAVEYRDIPGFPGYRVGSDGSIWCCRRRGRLAHIPRLVETWRQLRPKRKADGYLVVNIRHHPKDRIRTCFVHRLVLEAFVGPCPPGLQTRHCNGKRDDNRAVNLLWGTQVENEADKDCHNTKPRGSQRSNARLLESDIPLIRALAAEGKLQIQIAQLFDVSQGAICDVINRRTWNHVPELK